MDQHRNKAMGSGNWMQVELSTEVQFQLRAAEFEFVKAAKKDPIALATAAAMLHKQAAIYQVLLQQATRRIAELDCQLALAPQPQETDWLAMAGEIAPQAPDEEETLTPEQRTHFVKRVLRWAFDH
jgi:hypothetical protein